ncbi:hypothetical protein [Geofilum rubicundum]|uniref:hypothetical protein n=1 Tax=Geofilum rubicundum TaxID=472113 RepID=UPI00078316A9|nr:hypothetical protein [Geofilum rubicundum]
MNNLIKENQSENTICFACQQEIITQPVIMNKRFNLPVCPACHQTNAEKKAEQEALDSLGEDFVCGCI